MHTPPKSEKLAALAEQLRLYKPPPVSPDEIEEDEEAENEETVARLDPELPDDAVAAVTKNRKFNSRRAAVLICLFEGDDGEIRVILTKRSSRMSSHSGEVALPGGKAEKEDEDDAATATREAFEEIGLEPSLVHPVATLQPYISKHQLMVNPVIAILFDREAFKPNLSSSEVETIFDAPLEMFLKDENHRSEEEYFMGSSFVLQFFQYKTFLIWGLTAAILIQVASLVYQKPPEFVVHNPKVKFPKHFYR